jgi:acetylornithine deacetylase/succinyl-diaminopimelate desuccinylase-like protein
MNVIPSEAEATIDIRMAPGEDDRSFMDQMQRLIADPAVKIDRLTEGERPATPPSRLDNEMFRALEAVSKRIYPGSVTLPTMLTGATDMAFLRAKGMQSYGIGAASTDADRTNFGAHSDVERLLESSLYTFTRFTWEAVLEVAAAK